MQAGVIFYNLRKQTPHYGAYKRFPTQNSLLENISSFKGTLVNIRLVVQISVEAIGDVRKGIQL